MVNLFFTLPLLKIRFLAPVERVATESLYHRIEIKVISLFARQKEIKRLSS